MWHWKRRRGYPRETKVGVKLEMVTGVAADVFTVDSLEKLWIWGSMWRYC